MQRCIARILGVEGLSDAERDQAALPPKGGGLGLPECADTAPAACIAAWSGVLPLLKQHLESNASHAGMYSFIVDTLFRDEVDDPTGVVAAFAKLKVDERWLNAAENKAAVRPNDPGKAKAPVTLGRSARNLLTRNKKQTELSLSLLTNSRMKAQLLAPRDDYYDATLTNKDRRRIVSCAGFLAHEWMGMAPRTARIGIAPPAVPGPAFRLVLQFRMGLLLTTLTAAGRVCTCRWVADACGDHSVGCKLTGLVWMRSTAACFTFSVRWLGVWVW